MREDIIENVQHKSIKGYWGKKDPSRDDGHRDVKGRDQRRGQPKPTMWENTNGKMCVLKRKI